MSPVGFAVNVFIALFALIDPVGMVPLFAAATLGAPAPAQRRIALYVAMFTFVFMSGFFLTGLGLLKFFGISMPAFRIAGGLMLLLMGLNMARDDLSTMFAEVKVEAGEALSTSAYARRRFEALIVPFGMPLLVGPGAISAAVIYAGAARPLGWAGYLAGVAAIFGVSACVFVTFVGGRLISRALGKIWHDHRGAGARADPDRHGRAVHHRWRVGRDPGPGADFGRPALSHPPSLTAKPDCA